MSRIYTRTFRVRWSELDARGQVSPSSYLRYLVETAYDWGEALGLGAKSEETLGLFWLIRETEINFFHPLNHDDIFDFTIWMINWQRVRGTRFFEIKLKDTGTVVAQGTQHIVCMDRETQRPTNPPESIINNFRLDEPRIFPYERFPKITRSTNSYQCPRKVEWQDLDALKHVNNSVYVNFAEETAAKELHSLDWSPLKLSEHNLSLATRRIHIQYLSPAVWGEDLVISTQALRIEQDGGSRFVGINRKDGSVVAECILDWKLVDSGSGAEQALPKEFVEHLAR